MDPLAITAITILIALTLYWTKGLVDRYLDLQSATYRDMDVFFDKAIGCILAVTDKKYYQPPPPPEINEVTIKSLMELTDIVKELVERVNNLDKLDKEVKDLQGNVSSIQVGRAFVPRRKD